MLKTCFTCYSATLEGRRLTHMLFSYIASRQFFPFQKGSCVTSYQNSSLSVSAKLTWTLASKFKTYLTHATDCRSESLPRYSLLSTTRTCKILYLCSMKAVIIPCSEYHTKRLNRSQKCSQVTF